MTKTELLFLEAIKASLTNSYVEWNQEISSEEWFSLFQMAENHQLLPLFYEAVYKCPAIKSCDPGILAGVKRSTMSSVMCQMMKTADFYRLYHSLKQNGIMPCVVKGIVCRNLYQKPDHRSSGDEDIFIDEGQFEQCVQVMREHGMVPADPNSDMEKDYEVPFGKPRSFLMIELHKHMFAPEEAAYCEFNNYFDGIHDQLISVEIDGNQILTMPHTEHLLFLICHAYKHFVHGGFGIRQICDIILFAETYGEEINWDDLYQRCCDINAEVFAAAMFKMGEQYLIFDVSKAGMSESWEKLLLQVNPENMLKDLLAAGVFGQAEDSRKQSSTVTVGVLTAEKQGKRQKNSVISALFPPRHTLSGRYPYLHNHPYLLPIAWGDRMIKHVLRSRSSQTDMTKALQIAQERVDLMREYGIIR